MSNLQQIDSGELGSSPNSNSCLPQPLPDFQPQSSALPVIHPSYSFEASIVPPGIGQDIMSTHSFGDDTLANVQHMGLGELGSSPNANSCLHQPLPGSQHQNSSLPEPHPSCGFETSSMHPEMSHGVPLPTCQPDDAMVNSLESSSGFAAGIGGIFGTSACELHGVPLPSHVVVGAQPSTCPTSWFDVQGPAIHHDSALPSHVHLSLDTSSSSALPSPPLPAFLPEPAMEANAGPARMHSWLFDHAVALPPTTAVALPPATAVALPPTTAEAPEASRHELAVQPSSSSHSRQVASALSIIRPDDDAVEAALPQRPAVVRVRDGSICITAMVGSDTGEVHWDWTGLQMLLT